MAQDDVIYATELIGSKHGEFFSTVGGRDGRFVKRLTTWFSEGGWIGELKIDWNKGPPDFFGEKTMFHGQHGDITFAQGERVASLLRESNLKSLFRRTLLQTDGGQTFDFGSKVRLTGQEAVNVEVASGYLVGVFGRRIGNDIGALGFYFLQGIESVTITNIRYNNPPIGKELGIVSERLASCTFVNEGNSPSVWDFSGSVERTDTRSWTQYSSLAFGSKVTVKSKELSLVQVGDQVHWGWAHGSSSSSSSSSSSRIAVSSQTKTLSWKLAGTQGPGLKMQCSSSCHVGVLEVPYVSSVEIVFCLGGRAIFEEEGIFVTTMYTGSTVATATNTLLT